MFFNNILIKGDILEAENNEDIEFVYVKMPQRTLEKVKKIVEKSNGLFEDETDYIHHCVICYNRNS